MKHKRQTLSKTDDDESGKDDLKDSNSKKSCQGCELPSDDIPDSTSSSRGMNNSTPNAAMTPNSTVELGTPTGGGGGSSSGIGGGGNAVSADSSVASTGSLDDEEEIHAKVKKKSDVSTGDISRRNDYLLNPRDNYDYLLFQGQTIKKESVSSSKMISNNPFKNYDGVGYNPKKDNGSITGAAPVPTPIPHSPVSTSAISPNSNGNNNNNTINSNNNNNIQAYYNQPGPFGVIKHKLPHGQMGHEGVSPTQAGSTTGTGMYYGDAVYNGTAVGGAGVAINCLPPGGASAGNQTPQPSSAAAMVSLDNSNSSSDFNFLSNLANDFAPEYYQLS
uniref:Uncharacterized protein n=1 Tax=Anopheles atroparvus TaxID=41427 RepID=A0A182J2K9_ANOAO